MFTYWCRVMHPVNNDISHHSEEDKAVSPINITNHNVTVLTYLKIMWQPNKNNKDLNYIVILYGRSKVVLLINTMKSDLKINLLNKCASLVFFATWNCGVCQICEGFNTKHFYLQTEYFKEIRV